MSVVTSSVSPMNDDLPDLDASGLLAAASAAVRARRLAEVADLQVLAQWAAIHTSDPTHEWDALVQLGGEGTPSVQDFCLGEIALARGTGVTATSNALADTLDLIHRLPETWAVCKAGDAEIHIARRVAKLSRHLPADKVTVVDRAVARIIGHESGGRVLAVAEAKIIEADPGLHEQRVEAERCRRYVSSSRTDEFGLRTVIARVRGRRRGLGRGHPRPGRRDHRAQVPRRHAPTSSGRSHSAGWPAPRSCWPCSWSTAIRQEELEVAPSRADGVPGRPARRVALRRSVGAGAAGRALRPPSRVGGAWRGRHRPGRGPGPDDAVVAPVTAGPHPPDRQTGARPGRPGPHHRLRAPRVAEGTGPPDLRRRLLALRHVNGAQRRLRPPHPTRLPDPGPHRHPQLRPARPPTSPLEDPRRLPRPAVRRRSLRLADPARARLPGRPPRHPPDQRGRGPADPRRPARRGHLPDRDLTSLWRATPPRCGRSAPRVESLPWPG